MVSYAGQRKRVAALRRIGTWATYWWGASCVYILLLVWQSKDLYRPLSGFSLQAWWTAIHGAFSRSGLLQMLCTMLVIGWVIGGWLWLRELKRQRISYKVALRDLFFTIRK